MSARDWADEEALGMFQRADGPTQVAAALRAAERRGAEWAEMRVREARRLIGFATNVKTAEAARILDEVYPPPDTPT